MTCDPPPSPWTGDRPLGEAALIDFVDNLLRQLFLTSVPGLTSETQVGFQPPDESWRSTVATLTVDGQPAGALTV